jgi:iron-sulfur cluster repair protein YtfE (RIC family)
MNPSQVRTRILDGHRVLRDQLAKLEAEIDALARHEAQVESVAETARWLLAELTAHTQLEDDVLAPALRELDAWGAVRANMLLEHHELQRGDLRRLVSIYDQSQDPQLVTDITLALIADIRADMHHEETGLLSATLLRDDPISVDMEAG